MKAVMTIFLVLVALAAMAQNRKSKSKAGNLTPGVKKQSPALQIRVDSSSPYPIRQPVTPQNRKTRKPSAKSGNVSGEKLDDLKNPFDTSKVKMAKQQVNQTGNESSNRSRQLNTGKPGRKNDLINSSFIPVKTTESNVVKSQDKPKEFKDTQFGAGAVVPLGNTPSTKRKRKGRGK
jgi:hypothetical protein